MCEIRSDAAWLLHMSEDETRRQEDELLALSSIFPDTLTLWKGLDGLQFVKLTVPLDWGSPVAVQIRQVGDREGIYGSSAAGALVAGRAGGARVGDGTRGPVPPTLASLARTLRHDSPAFDPVASTSRLPISSTSVETLTISLQHLPPLEVEFVLPTTYPSGARPEIHLSCSAAGGHGDWLSDATRDELLRQMNDLWAGDESLWSMIDVLSPSSIPLSFASPHPSSLSKHLLDFNQTSLSHSFSHTSFFCTLCLSHRKGAHCTALEGCGSGAVFCKGCLKDFFSLLIAEGDTETVGCPCLVCVKARGGKGEKVVMAAQELRGIVGEELTARFAHLVEKRRIDNDPSYTTCPRPACQASVPPPTSLAASNSESTLSARLSDLLRVCPACTYAFCVLCSTAYHALNPCPTSHSTRLIAAYLSGSPSEQQALERKYGKGNVKRLVDAAEEERQNNEWRLAHTISCPTCGVRVERSAGCSHMTCSRCSGHFCFRCGITLSGIDPYSHYSDPSSGSKCYQKLFDFLPGNEPPIEEWLGAVLADEH